MEEKRTIRKRAKRLAVKTAREWTTHNVGTYASSIAFFFFMSLVPLLIITLQLLPIAGLSRLELLDFICRLVPESEQGLATMIVTEAYRNSKSILSLSALILFWSASRGTMALRWGLNRVYKEKENRSYPLLCLISIGYTMAMIVLFAVILFLIFAGPVSRYLMQQVPDLMQNPVTIEVRQKVLLNVIVIVVFSLVYTVVPAGSRNFFRQLPGAVLVCITWNIFSRLFSIYIEGYNAYTMFYGSLGTIAIMLFWLYCCFYILLIGAFFNCFCGERWERIKKELAGIRKKKPEE